eukprot:CAMPEP_0179073170 /NCGR_PEP_ID=MMETSP0796-20121207/32433_1 /TAXON_ID=73915 /ORGANISM="Pyrodinium bahamense, Strain pbaha01" /LENGTH=179 /DNA_ID=CAMNT_0020770355 /DNA_START=556 /DNA_END=1091 /DNA_ORIENTATION=-
MAAVMLLLAILCRFASFDGLKSVKCPKFPTAPIISSRSEKRFTASAIASTAPWSPIFTYASEFQAAIPASPSMQAICSPMSSGKRCIAWIMVTSLPAAIAASCREFFLIWIHSSCGGNANFQIALHPLCCAVAFHGAARISANMGTCAAASLPAGARCCTPWATHDMPARSRMSNEAMA